MSPFVLDTSAVVKRYVLETGTIWVRSICAPVASHRIFLARITDVEFTSAVVRRKRSGTLSAHGCSAILQQFRQDLLLGYGIIEVTPSVVTTARLLAERHGRRAYDAVQLAAAVEFNTRWLATSPAGITLISADQELNAAARIEGLSIEDPNLHP